MHAFREPDIIHILKYKHDTVPEYWTIEQLQN